MDKVIVDNLGKLNIDSILRRKEPERQAPLPSEMFQVGIFFSQPVIAELNFNDEEAIKEIVDNTTLLNKIQVKWTLNHIDEIVPILLDKQRFVFPFYSNEVFLSKQEAQNFVPLFIKKLIQEEKLPQDIILDGGLVDDTRIQASLVPLTITFIERNLSEFRENNVS